MSVGNDIVKTMADTLEERIKRNRFYIALGKANKEFIAKYGDDYNVDDFSEHILEQYGIELVRTKSGMFTEEYSVIDEKKYVFFELKYG